jgi:hypothetical protein
MVEMSGIFKFLHSSTIVYYNMKFTKITCAYCGTEVEKPSKEINRQKRKGRESFYCNSVCSGKAGPTAHLREYDSTNTGNIIPGSSKDEYSHLREHLRRAKSRDASTDLTLEYLDALWKSQEGRCVYTNVLLLSTSETSNYNYMASLDRIDNSKGYKKGNVQFTSVSCNWLKNKETSEHIKEFFDIIISSKNLPK